MIIIGEKINTSRKEVEAAVRNGDSHFIGNLARMQAEAGADYIDVNAGTFVNDEPVMLEWLVKTVQAVADKPLCIDTPNPLALAKALEVHKGKAMINSITAETARYDNTLPLIRDYGCAVIALCMDDRGIPEGATERIDIAGRLYNNLLAGGVKAEDIYFDPLLRPISTGGDSAKVALTVIEGIMRLYPSVHTICGLSNISYGLPHRRLLNRAFLAMAVMVGLDAVILDPNDKDLMAELLAAEALSGRDEFCINYITASRGSALGTCNGLSEA
jgi:cobalamin-dependent methionine synthase I